MKLIIIASVISVCAAARLEHLEAGYLPPGARGSASFGSSGSLGFDGSNNGLNRGPGSLGGSVQSHSGVSGGNAFGAASASSPQFSSRNNFENIPQQAFDEETGYQYGPGINNFRSAAGSSNNQIKDVSPSSSNLVESLNSRFNAPSKPVQQPQQSNDVSNFRSASAPSQQTFVPNQLGATAQTSTNKIQSGLNSRFNTPSQQGQQFNSQDSENEQPTDADDDDNNKSTSNQRFQTQISTAQRPTTRYQPNEVDTQSNLGEQSVGVSKPTAQSSSRPNQQPQFDTQPQTEDGLNSNGDVTQKQSLTSRFNAPNEQFSAASQQVGTQKAAGRQFGARFGAPDFAARERNPFENIPQQAFDEKTGYVY